MSPYFLLELFKNVVNVLTQESIYSLLDQVILAVWVASFKRNVFSIVGLSSSLHQLYPRVAGICLLGSCDVRGVNAQYGYF